MWLYIFLTIISLVIAFLLKVKIAKFVFVLSLLGVVLSLLADKFNIMLTYEEWIERGMPEWGEKVSRGNDR